MTTTRHRLVSNPNGTVRCRSVWSARWPLMPSPSGRPSPSSSRPPPCSLDRALALGVIVAAVTAALIGSIDVTPSARPGTTGRLLGRELVVVSLALLSLPIALAPVAA